MRYRKIAFTNHPILGTINLDFVNSVTGVPYQNVIFAGENGIGKTVILQFMNTFSPDKRVRDIGLVHLEVEVSAKDVQLLIEKTHEVYGDNFYLGDFPDHLLKFEYDSSNTDANNWGKGEYVDAKGNNVTKLGYLFAPIFRSIFSRAEIVFSPNQIKSVTALEIDEQEMDHRLSTEKLSTEIKQLFVDINTRDALEGQEWVDNHPGMAPTEDIKHQRLKRFTNAFNKMFPAKRLKRVNSQNGSIDVIFEENGKQMSIDHLSSGEKEIVFRGGFMLRDKQNAYGCVALVDEPELSMHPRWEKKILDFYIGLFNDEHNIQQCQLFVATHSVYVLERALESRSDSLVVVLSKDNTGNIVCNNITAPNKLSYITSAETSYLAFGIYSVDYHIELFGEYQRRNNLTSIKGVDSHIMSTPQYTSNLPDYHRHSEFRKADGTLACTYETVCCLVRNHIDHPDTSVPYNEADLINSTELLRSLL